MIVAVALISPIELPETRNDGTKRIRISPERPKSLVHVINLRPPALFQCVIASEINALHDLFPLKPGIPEDFVDDFDTAGVSLPRFRVRARLVTLATGRSKRHSCSNNGRDGPSDQQPDECRGEHPERPVDRQDEHADHRRCHGENRAEAAAVVINKAGDATTPRSQAD